MRRSEFTAQTKRDAYKRADGCCQSCAVKLRDGESQYHHVIEARLGGTNSLANCLVLCPRCHKAVTKDTSIPRITRMKHMRDARQSMRAVRKRRSRAGARCGQYRTRLDFRRAVTFSQESDTHDRKKTSRPKMKA